ncbi:LysE family translocator [Pseudonocardia sp. NPDC046786]|uniref:LysE family translocator n=1 Tax=Pseudonocardia sp. NPDC046786 TaxID=3155471 RepID=UPI0033D233B2
MAVDAVVAFWGLSLLLVLTPGADWAYVIGAGLGQRTILPAVAGLLTGHLALTGAVAAGIAALVAGSPATLTVLTGIGAGYLIWLGATGLARPAGTGTGLDTATGTGGRLRAAAKGAGTSGLNPKALLLFLTLMPRFTDPAGDWPVAGQILVLGAVHVACCGVVYLAVGIGARRVLAARPSWTRTVSRVSGGAMVATGAGLLVGQLAL